MTDPLPVHVPVQLDEVVRWLQPQPGGVFVDGTAGGGGHTRVLAEHVGPTGLVIALDCDPQAIAMAGRRLAEMPVHLVRANFCDLPEVLAQLDVAAVDGVLLDLGVSSDQLADPERGFSFNSPGSLDLRFDPLSGEPAWRLLSRLRAERLAELIHRYGEERYSRRIARAIVQRRREQPIRTARDLTELIEACVPRKTSRRGIHPATRTFQALRVAVNDELRSLEIALRRIPDCLRPRARMAVISFHSLEDRRVKEAFRADSRLEPLCTKPIRPTAEEIARNPRARSAKLRVALRKE